MTEHPNPGAAAIQAARSATVRRGDIGRGRPANGTTTAEAAARFNVSEKSVSRARALLDSGNLQLIESVERGETSLAAAYCQLHQPIETPDDSPPPSQEKPSMLTRETLLPSVENVQTLIARWQEADNLQARAELYEPLADAVEQLNGMIDTNDCHPDAWPMILEADQLVTHSRQWLPMVGALDPQVTAAADAAAQAGETDEKPEQLPTIETLRDQGVTHSLIAQRYRWLALDQDGKVVPDVSRVAVALAYPSAPRVPGPNPKVVREQLARSSPRSDRFPPGARTGPAGPRPSDGERRPPAGNYRPSPAPQWLPRSESPIARDVDQARAGSRLRRKRMIRAFTRQTPTRLGDRSHEKEANAATENPFGQTFPGWAENQSIMSAAVCDQK